MFFEKLTEDNSPGDFRKQRPVFCLPQETVSTCVISCPIHQDIRGILFLLQKRKFKEALENLLELNPLPSSVSRICPTFCEKGCVFLRKDFDEPIAINLLERFLGDRALKRNYAKEVLPTTEKEKVAVVGSGPAGLTCAYILRNNGYPVFVFEKEKELGGLLRFGIPENRLPKKILDAELNLHFKNIAFFRNTEINEGNFEWLKKEFRAIFLTPGFSEGKVLDIPQANFPNALTALDFLKKTNYGEINGLKNKTVFIVGAGNTAMDTARTALKSGAKVEIFFRREKIRAYPGEAEEIEKMGAVFHPKTLKFGEDYDLLIFAVGQKKSAFMESLTEPGIFRGGDFLSGPKTAAHAIGSGNKGAKKIIAFLKGRSYQRGKPRIKIGRHQINLDCFMPQKRSEGIQKETKRCFNCGLCALCKECFENCPEPAILYRKGHLEINYQHCKGCLNCKEVCPRGAIKEEAEEEE